MVNDIIQGISAAAATVKNVAFYDSEAEQEFNPPCFFVQPLELDTVPQIMGQEMRMQPFDLQYFPANDEGRNSLYDLAEQLVPILRVLTLQSGQKIRGSNIKYEVQNGNLHLFVNYNVILRPSEETPQMMENLTQDQEVKE
jgi:hypothetical protein